MQTRLHARALALTAVVLMSACGGGGSDDTPEPVVEVPDSALTSSTAYTQFARGLGSVDTAEPLTLGRLEVAPTSETDEPASLD